MVYKTHQNNAKLLHCFRKGASRYLILSKKDGTLSSNSKGVHFEIIRNSKGQIGNLLQRFPLSSKERLELMPNMDKNQVNEGMQYSILMKMFAILLFLKFLSFLGLIKHAVIEILAIKSCDFEPINFVNFVFLHAVIKSFI